MITAAIVLAFMAFSVMEIEGNHPGHPNHQSQGNF